MSTFNLIYNGELTKLSSNYYQLLNFSGLLWAYLSQPAVEITVSRENLFHHVNKFFNHRDAVV